jgi:anti-sigma factor RsiW
MSISPQAHVSDERLEQYLLGRLPESDVNELEEHLLVCSPCQDLLEETEQYLATMRIAAAQLLSSAERQPFWSKWLRFVFEIPKPALAAAACALFAFILLMPRDPQAATVDLESLRGPESAVQAPSRANLTLRLSLAGMTAVTGPLEVQIADTDGSIVARSSAEIEGSRALARVDALRPGVYWVRLHEKGELVREFGLTVR